MAVFTASKYVKSAKNFMRDIKKDVSFSIEMEEDVMIGKDFDVVVQVTNNSSSDRNVEIAISGSTVYYTGVKKSQLISSKGSLSVKAEESSSFKVTCKAEAYLKELTEFGGFVFFVMGLVSQTKQTYSVQKTFVLEK
ncbi:hypothetical protein, partial [Salmonella sp. s55004]|uniref:hypothetical protein n=1 Tax=Salmonella sp. s55004 TaxID=3159675 RepID=UPI00398113D2